MVDRLVAVDDADYRLPEPVLQALGTDVADESSSLGENLSSNFAPTKVFKAAVGDNTAALQGFLNGLSSGDDALIRGTVDFTTVDITKSNVRVRLAPGAILNKTTAFTDGIIISASDVTLEGGSINCPAQWDGTNTAWTYAVVNVKEASARFTARGVTLNNVPKVGIGVRSNDAQILGCRIYGNYPSAQWTGVETANFAITFDPAGTETQGGGIVSACHIRSCVQGVMLANYGGGIGYGYTITGNSFQGCHNHGIYASSGVGNVIVGNAFFTCQIPVVIAGRSHVVSGNTMFTASTGGSIDYAGISVRDAFECVISDNTIVGDSTTLNIAISVDSLNGTALRRNLVTNNTIFLNGTGGNPSIRVGTSLTQISEDNRVEGNVISSPGKVSGGMIEILMAVGYTGFGNTVANNSLALKGNTHGIRLLRQRYAQVHGNSVRNEYSSGAGTTMIQVFLEGVTDSLVQGNMLVNPSTFGTNVTLQGVREDATCDRNVIGPNVIKHDMTLLAGSTMYVKQPGSIVGADVGNYVAATTLGTLSGKVEVRDAAGVVKGYLPVYTTIT